MDGGCTIPSLLTAGGYGSRGASFRVPGAWALDSLLDRQTRVHSDVDLGIARAWLEQRSGLRGLVECDEHATQTRRQSRGTSFIRAEVRHTCSRASSPTGVDPGLLSAQTHGVSGRASPHMLDAAADVA
jgi:hypothetical protein